MGWAFEARALPALGIRSGTPLSFLGRLTYEVGVESAWDHAVHGDSIQDAILFNAVFFGGGEFVSGFRHVDARYGFAAGDRFDIALGLDNFSSLQFQHVGQEVRWHKINRVM